MKSDQASGIVTALGRVEIEHNGHILHADKVTYNQRTGVMHAEGHVALLSPEGDVEFSDRQDITGDMKQAFATNIGILFPDNSRLTARTAQRFDGRYVVADKAMYTSCNVCKENPDNPPLWQMRAKQIVHDNVEHDIYYHDVAIDFAGVPVFYTPYMSGPDPTVERRQGFLTASPGISSNIGAFVRVPYYFDIAPNIDAVIAPTFSAVDKAQFGGEYRQRFAHGDLKLDGTFTYAKLTSDTGTDEGNQWRGHLFGNFLYNIDNVWRAGTDIAISSDKSYLLRYQISSMDELTNRAYVEGFKGRDYAAVNAYYFEDLRPGAQPVQPIVLPEMTFSAYGEPGQTLGGRWSLDGSTLVTLRANRNRDLSEQGPNTRRLSINGGWERRFVSDTGLVADLSGLARADTYWADNVSDAKGSGARYNNVLLARPFAQANLVTSYPMGRQGDGYQQMLEPIIAFTAAPAVHVDRRQPIEDSLDVELDETNLFSPNRFTGTDLIEGGSRVTYGLRHTVTGDGGARVDMFGGQSYDFSQNDAFPGQSGLRDHMSD
ncbi:MAG: LPS assembly protein LptD, partial [Pseudomonadota bacterium]|nr:LPS assembly protein LptD [Pseudomonadota bacterium]